jgi:hypothetical protein
MRAQTRARSLSRGYRLHKTLGTKPCAHRRRRNHQAKALQFADDAFDNPRTCKTAR